MTYVGSRLVVAAFWCFILFGVGVSSAKPLALEEDTTSAVDESSWFKAEGHVRFLTKMAWELSAECTASLHCVDLFGASGKVRKSFAKKGFTAANFDIKCDQSHDLTTYGGCIALLSLLLALHQNGVVVAGPPCSLFVSACQSVHERSWHNIWGNLTNLRVRCANRIWLNFGIIMLVLRKLRADIHVLIEQPSSSWAFRLPIMEKVIAAWSMRRITTWMGCFGHDLCKCSHLLLSYTFRSGEALARTLTPKKRITIQNRFEKRQLKRKTKKVYYTKGANGSWSGGRDLASSAAYTAAFCNAVRDLWIKQQSG